MRSLLPRAAAPPAAPPSAPRRRRPARATPASSAESVEAEATEAAPPPPYYGRRRRVRRDFLRLDFEPVVPPLLDTVLADVHEELLAVAMGLNQPELAEAAQAELPPPRAGLQWLPRGQAASSLRDFRGPPPFDLFSLDAEELLGRLGGPPGPELAEQLGRVARRFFVERVYSRSQVLERCRRVYERDPFDSRKPGGEAQDLLLHFQQMADSHFVITNLVASRAEARDVEIGERLAEAQARGGPPPQSLPDVTDLAIADVALFLEYEAELLLQAELEERMVEREARERRARRAAAAASARRALARAALAMGVAPEAAGVLLRLGAGEVEEAVEEARRARQQPQQQQQQQGEGAGAGGEGGEGTTDE